jgi:hypothetical protein
MPSSDPIYIIGTERSGSNLLRLMLDAHSGIVVPHPPHVMHFFAPIEKCYGDLGDRARLRILVEDVLELVRAHIYAWDVPLDVDAITDAARPRDALGVMAAIYDAARAASGKRRWGNKSTFMVHHVERALARDTAARFVWLVRDPRDVAVSSRTSVFSTCHPFNTGRLWAMQQAEALAQQKRVPEAIHLLRYEELCDEPEKSLRALCAFLGEDYEPRMLQYFEGSEAQKSASLSESWKNTASPVQRTNHGRWRKELTAADVRMVEASAAPIMRRLGYEAATPENDLRSFHVSLGWIGVMEAAYRARVELRSLRTDVNHWQRWHRDATVRGIRRKRCT